MNFTNLFFSLLTAGFLILSSTCLFAQINYFEDFENGFPADYITINVDGLTPNLPEDMVFLDSAWTAINSGLLNSWAAISLSWYVNDAGPADDWMILPKMTISATSELSWTAISTTSSGNFPDSYMVLINAGEPTNTDFENNGFILMTVDPEEYMTAQMRSIDLSSYAGQDVHIAFRNITGSGDALLIDDIMITDVLLVGVEEVDNPSFSLSAHPNPAISETKVGFTVEQAGEVTLELRNLTGQTIMTRALGFVQAGDFTENLSVEGIPSGTYLLTVRTKDKIGFLKILISG